MRDNFVGLHKMTRDTPAIAAGVADFAWSMEDLATMTDAYLVSKKGTISN